MHYIGSKSRIAKDLVSIIDRERQGAWIEPFVGGANLICEASGERLGADINPYVIACLEAVRDGWVPPSQVSKSEYLNIRDNPSAYPDSLVGFVGTCSYRAKFFGGYCDEQRVGMAQRNLLKQAPKLQGIRFEVASYLELDCGSGNTIVCDPPYRGATKYRGQAFDHDEFYDWCCLQRKRGNIVYVCEYDAPFECVWEQEVANHLSPILTEKRARERLYRVS